MNDIAKGIKSELSTIAFCMVILTVITCVKACKDEPVRITIVQSGDVKEDKP